jgi:hypothetical protein
MTDLDAVVRSIVGMPQESREARRVRELEAATSRFLEFCVATDVPLGMGREFNQYFRDLCETVGFDADEYREQGFDPKDV